MHREKEGKRIAKGQNPYTFQVDGAHENESLSSDWLVYRGYVEPNIDGNPAECSRCEPFHQVVTTQGTFRHAAGQLGTRTAEVKVKARLI